MEVLFALRRRGMAQIPGEVLNLKELLFRLFPSPVRQRHRV